MQRVFDSPLFGVLAFVALLAGCMSVGTPPAPVPPVAVEPVLPAPAAPNVLVGGEWKVLTINSAPLTRPGTVTMSFSAEGNVGGRGPCNGFGAQAAISTNEIAFTPGVGTQMACMPESIMDEEAAMMRLFNGIAQWRINDEGVLTLDGPTTKLTLKR